MQALGVIVECCFPDVHECVFNCRSDSSSQFTQNRKMTGCDVDAGDIHKHLRHLKISASRFEQAAQAAGRSLELSAYIEHVNLQSSALLASIQVDFRFEYALVDRKMRCFCKGHTGIWTSKLCIFSSRRSLHHPAASLKSTKCLTMR